MRCEESRRNVTEEFGSARAQRDHPIRRASLMRERNYFGAMIKLREADAMVSGYARSYPSALRPILETVGKFEGQQSGGDQNVTQRGRFLFQTLRLTLTLRRKNWQHCADDQSHHQDAWVESCDCMISEFWARTMLMPLKWDRRWICCMNLIQIWF